MKTFPSLAPFRRPDFTPEPQFEEVMPFLQYYLGPIVYALLVRNTTPQKTKEAQRAYEVHIDEHYGGEHALGTVVAYAISDTMKWADTPEGEDYWSQLYVLFSNHATPSDLRGSVQPPTP